MPSIVASALRLAPVVVGLVASLAIGSTAAAPKKAKKSIDKSASARDVNVQKVLGTSSALPKVELRHDAALIRQVRRTKGLTKSQKIRILSEAGIRVEQHELEQPAVLDVRDPYHDASTHLSFVGSVAVLPGAGGGVADVDAGIIIPGSLNPFADLFFGSSDSSTAPAPAMNFALVQFRAAAGKHYIVDCIAAGEGDFITQLIADDALVSGGFTYADGHAIQLVPSASSARDVQVQLLGGRPWSMRRCEITPVG